MAIAGESQKLPKQSDCEAIRIQNASKSKSGTPASRILQILFVLVFIAGALARIVDSTAWRQIGPDELMYRRYVNFMDGYRGVVGVFPSDERGKKSGYNLLVPFEAKIESTGAMAMPEISNFYLTTQRSPETLCELPPTRFLYIYTSWLWKRAQFGDQPPLSLEELQTVSRSDDYSRDPDRRDPALASLHRVACTFNILLILIGGLFAARMFGSAGGIGVLALLAFDPLQLHLSQHAMVHG
jgi:hypothetical protein